MIFTREHVDLEPAITLNKSDKLNGVAINSLPHPLTVVLYNLWEWEVYDICVKTGAMRIMVCGKLQAIYYGEVKKIIDGEGEKHDPDNFWNESYEG